MAKANLKETVADCQTRAKASAERLVKSFSFVPDDKLNWSPSPTARNSIALVTHCVMGNQAFAKVIRGEPMSPMPTADELHAMSKKFEATIRDRSEAVRLLGTSCDEAVAALATMTAARLATTPNSPFGPFPMAFWMNLPDMHMGYHASQMNYLQTIWGDLVDHA